MKNPVQVILNSNNYIFSPEPNGGGGNTDFFENRDKEFEKHKNHLNLQLQKLKSASQNEILAIVTLQEKATAKSHRPIKKLFNPKEVEIQSGESLGSLIVEFDKSMIDKLQSIVLNAENETNWVDDFNKKPKSKPSAARSDVGAISDIRIYEATDRRKFSIDDAFEWLADPRTGGCYYIELFGSIELYNANNTFKKREHRKSIFMIAIKKLQRSIGFQIIEHKNNILSDNFLIIKMPKGCEIEKHKELIYFLEAETLVKHLYLPPIIQKLQNTNTEKTFTATDAIQPNPDTSYPIVGIIDTGVSPISSLSPWRVDGTGYISESDQDRSHGTFIAGLISQGTSLNNNPYIKETPCKFFDLDLFPNGSTAFDYYYPNGFIDFLEQLDLEIPQAVDAGVRIFNMSLSLTTCVNSSGYSVFANALDNISKKHNIIFVLPAGNLSINLMRDPWPDNDIGCIESIAAYPHAGEDRIFQPAESVRSLTVGAVNCSTLFLDKITPAIYSRRGPGPAYGSKPDLVHIGGNYPHPHLLKSYDTLGNIIENCGTSFAAPLVASTLANLDHIIDGDVPIETLIALLISECENINWLSEKRNHSISKDFLGNGIPQPSYKALLHDNNKISLVFYGELQRKQQLTFEFNWPSCLTDSNGKCSGTFMTTLVYSPPVNQANGSEFIMCNLTAYLRQKNSKTEQYHGRTHPLTKHSIDEAGLIKNGQKWWPIKKMYGDSKNGIGNSSEWRLVVDLLGRSGFEIPNPIPFCVILTISDPYKNRDVFNSLRSELIAQNVNLSDIRTALRNTIQNQ